MVENFKDKKMSQYKKSFFVCVITICICISSAAEEVIVKDDIDSAYDSAVIYDRTVREKEFSIIVNLFSKDILDRTTSIAVVKMHGVSHERFLKMRKKIRQSGRVKDDVELDIISYVKCYAEVKDVLRGEMGKMILIESCYPKINMLHRFHQPMRPEKGSVWLVFLKHPFGIEHHYHEKLKKKLRLTGLTNFVRKDNYFMVTGGLFSAALLEWPKKGLLYRYVPDKAIVDDIKTMLLWLEHRDDEDFEKISEQYRSSIESKLGKAIFEEVVKRIKKSEIEKNLPIKKYFPILRSDP
jgi:hypothetical protein